MDAVVVIDKFRKHLASRGYAETTCESYAKNLEQFKRHLLACGVTDLRKVTHQVILDYQQKVSAEPIALETRALKLRPVKRLFEYLTETNRLLVNPAEGIVEVSRKGRKGGTVLTMAEVSKLLAQPDLSQRVHLRNRTILEVLYSTGIRLTELLELEVGDEKLTDRVLFIRKGKGGKQRLVPLGAEAVGFLAEYLDKARPHFGKKNPKETKLFLNHSGRPLAKHSVREFLKDYRRQAGIVKAVSPHTLRRSCATHLMQQGADVRHIQALLGHARLDTTQVYIRVLLKEVKQTHEETHPGKGL